MEIRRLEDIKSAEDWRALIWHELSPEELKEAYALAKAAFTADDLQKFTELDLYDGVPVDELLAEMEEAQKQADQKSS